MGTGWGGRTHRCRPALLQQEAGALSNRTVWLQLASSSSENELRGEVMLSHLGSTCDGLASCFSEDKRLILCRVSIFSLDCD